MLNAEIGTPTTAIGMVRIRPVEAVFESVTIVLTLFWVSNVLKELPTAHVIHLSAEDSNRRVERGQLKWTREEGNHRKIFTLSIPLTLIPRVLVDPPQKY